MHCIVIRLQLSSCWSHLLLCALSPIPLVASYPGLFTPAFVTCNTNAGKGLVKLSHVQWRTWMCGGVAHSFCMAVKWLSESKKHHQGCLMSSAQSLHGPCLRSIAHLLAAILRMCHSSTCPGTSLHVISFTRPPPSLVLQATGEKAWVRGYNFGTFSSSLPGLVYCFMFQYMSQHD